MPMFSWTSSRRLATLALRRLSLRSASCASPSKGPPPLAVLVAGAPRISHGSRRHVCEALADVWNCVLLGAPLPHVWLKVRVVMIPKEPKEPDSPSTGTRPISVAEIAWRLGMSVIVRDLTSWVDAWVPPDLVGGLAGRTPNALHERLFTDFADAHRGTQGPLAGAKIDVRKCFDSVDPRQALRVLTAFGAHPSLVRVLSVFYQGHTRWLEWMQAVSTQPAPYTRGLLQGCPASCLMLAGIMTVWHHHVSRVPDIRCGIFIDDRTLWSTGPNPVRTLQEALEVAKPIDRAFGLEWHPDKGELFASDATTADSLTVLTADVGPVVSAFTLLGIRYHTDARYRLPSYAKVVARMLVRLERIAVATRDQGLKRQAVLTLVLPILTWSGAWNRPTKQELRPVLSAIERAVCGWLTPGRSPFLLWVAELGASLCPFFGLDFAAVRHEVWRLRTNEPQPDRPSRRMQELARKWRWIPLGAGRFATPEGEVDLGWDGAAQVRHAARLGWERTHWKADKRASEGPAVDPADAHPDASMHAQCFRDHPRASQRHRVALGAGFCGVVEARRRLQPVHCECGEQNPSRRHLAWVCPLRGHSRPMPPPGPMQALGLPLVPHPPCPPARRLHAPLPRLVQALQAATPEPDGLILIATDGGSEGASAATRVAAWGASFAGNTFGGRVPGSDQTAAAAELWALFEVLLAAQAANVAVRIVIDNRGVAQTAARLLCTSEPLPRSKPLAWSRVRDVSRTLPAIAIHWVPSHGKRPDWRPPVPHHDADRWRALNDYADRRASAALRHAVTSVVPERQARAAALAQARSAISAFDAGITRFQAHLGPRPDPAGHRMQRRPPRHDALDDA